MIHSSGECTTMSGQADYTMCIDSVYEYMKFVSSPNFESRILIPTVLNQPEIKQEAVIAQWIAHI